MIKKTLLTIKRYWAEIQEVGFEEWAEKSKEPLQQAWDDGSLPIGIKVIVWAILALIFCACITGMFVCGFILYAAVFTIY